MQTRELGRTGVRVSVLSFGAAPLGGAYGSADPAEGIACVHRAVESGINFIDTSPYYGPLRSETVLGQALRGGWRDRIILSTKAGRIDTDVFDFSAAHVTRSVEDSLRRLGTDYVDVLFAHDIEFARDIEQVFTETADTLHRLKRQGKCRAVGMSGYPLDVLATAIERCHLDVVLSYCHYTLLNTRLVTELLPVAERHGVGLVNASPLAMGLLTRAGPPPWNPAPAAMREACRRAADLCASRGADLAAVALQFALDESRVATTLVGMPRLAELEANLRVLQMPVAQALREQVRAVLADFRDWSWPSGNQTGP